MPSPTQLENASPKFSKASKMPCLSWSLPALLTCPGSSESYENYSGKLQDWQNAFDSDAKLVPSCQGCYATTGNYLYKNVKAVREHNMQDWQKPDWVSKMVATLKHERYFRFFDSGDVYCVELAEKILEVCKRCPDTKFWIPTLAWKVAEIAEALESLENLDNVVVRRSTGQVITADSADDVDTLGWGQYSFVVENVDTVKAQKGIVVCRSYNRAGKCGQCRACWNRKVENVLYPAHGVVMKSKIKKNFEV